MKKKLNRNFYTGPTLKVAKELLGKYIVRKVGKRELVGKIIETEAYVGPQDRAAHSYKGKITLRNKIEYLIGGHIYIYLVYGMYWQLNITTAGKGEPECVLIRALEPVLDNSKLKIDSKFKSNPPGSPLRVQQNLKLTNGPGKLCRYLKLDKSFYGEDLSKNKRIWVEDRGEKIKPSQILATGRVGIDYASHYWSKRKWRFLIRDYRKSLAK